MRELSKVKKKDGKIKQSKCLLARYFKITVLMSIVVERAKDNFHSLVGLAPDEVKSAE
jgi:hypothetical protein